MKIIALFTLLTITLACTDFRYFDGFSARTMDFPIPEDTHLRLIPEGEHYNADEISWITKVGYLSFTLYGPNNTADGLNQCGLSCAVLTLLETEYQNYTGINSLGMTNSCDFILGQFCTTTEVQQAMSQLNIFRDILISGIPCPLLHLSIHDSSGQSLVIEFLKGQQIFHNNKIGILTNDPPYDWHIKNIQNYNYISNIFPTGDITINDFTFNAAYFGYPTSNFGISADDGPVSRFVRIAELIRYVDVTQHPLIMGYHLLEKVSVVPGYSKVKSGNLLLTDATIYRVIRDHTNLKIYFNTINNLGLKMVDLSLPITGGSIFLEDLHPNNYVDITTLFIL